MGPVKPTEASASRTEPLPRQVGWAEGAGVAQFSWDLRTDQVAWDQAMHALTQVPEPLSVPEWIEILSHPDDQTRLRLLHSNPLNVGAIPPTISRFVRPDGQVRWIVMTAEVTGDDQGLPQLVRGGLIDITEAQDQSSEFQRARNEQKLGQLTAGVAHNFNNLMMIIEPCLEALEDVVPDSHRAFVKDATEAGQRSSEIVRQLMTVGHQRKLEARAPHIFSHLCSEVVDNCRRDTPRNLRLDFEVDSHSEVDCSRTALQQVVANLLRNARNALVESKAAEGNVRIRVRDVSKEGQTWVEFVVTDNGPGIPEAVLARVFDPFFTTRTGAGTGLGLATSRAIVQEHGGLLACQSNEGQGTRFSLLLPALTSRTPQKSDPNMINNDIEKTSVLVVDDEPAICRVVTHTLKRNGFDAVSVSDPAQLDEILQSSTFHIILLDRSMGTIQGSSLLPELRQKAPLAKILYFTGEFVAPEEEAHVDGVVQKPVNGKQLTETLRQVR